MSARVAVVTGASRGAGRGIAIALGSHGCTVYVTGRSERPGDASLPGTIYETAEAVNAAGGKGVPVRVDHGDDEQVRALFQQGIKDQGGRQPQSYRVTHKVEPRVQYPYIIR